MASKLPGIFNRNPTTRPISGNPVQNKPLQNQYNVYTDSVNSDVAMRNELLKNYSDLFNQTQSAFANRSSFTPEEYTPEAYNYAPTQDFTESIAGLKGIAQTGGYSDQAIQDLRARAVSPVRAAYANANREVDRNRSLQGGYSPSYNALKGKMVREQSEMAAQALTNANASIASDVAAGKRGAAGQLVSATGEESSLKNQYGKSNIDARNQAKAVNTGTRNQAKQFNMTLPGNDAEMLQRLLEGIRGLYGTTPAISTTFGNQAMNANAQNMQNKQFGINTILSEMRR